VKLVINIPVDVKWLVVAKVSSDGFSVKTAIAIGLVPIIGGDDYCSKMVRCISNPPSLLIFVVIYFGALKPFFLSIFHPVLLKNPMS
jgi:hypothetical protein